MAFSELEKLVARLEVPQPDRLVITTTHEPVASAVKRNRPHEVRVAFKDRDAFARLNVPNPDCLVLGSGCEEVSRPLETGEPAFVTDEDSDNLSGVDVPKPEPAK
jgi:hypothetical protein